MTISEKLFAELDNKKIRQADLAKYLDVRNSVITNWKTRGTNPPSELIIHICKFLDISIFELLGEKIEYTSEEQKIITAYKKADKVTKENIKAILKIENNTNLEIKSSTSKIG